MGLRNQFMAIARVAVLGGLIVSCSESSNESSIGNLCEGQTTVAGVWQLENVVIDELGTGATNISNEEGSLEISCDGRYVEDYSFRLDGVVKDHTEEGEWSQEAQDQMIFDNGKVLINTTMSESSIVLVTSSLDSSSDLEQETTRLTFYSTPSN